MLFKRMNKRNFISSVVLVVALGVFSVMSTGNMQLPKLLNTIFIYAIAALALNVVCGCLGEFALGHGGFLLIGYTTAVIVSRFLKEVINPTFFNEKIFTTLGSNLHFLGYIIVIAIVVLAAVLTGLIGFAVGAIALGRLKGDYLAIVTLGISLIFVNICNNSKFLGNNGIGITISTVWKIPPILNYIFLVLVVILILVFMKTRYGRAILACRDDNIAAEACGVPVNKTKVLAFTFASFIAGISGGLLAFVTPSAPSSFGQDFSILFLIIIVLGGLGSLTGSILASVVIVLYNQWFCNLEIVPDFFSNYPKILYGVVLVLIMLFRSNGILGNSEFTWNWFYSKLNLLWKRITGIFSKKAPKEVEK